VSNEFIDVFGICFVVFIGWVVFAYLSRLNNYIKNYKKVALLFFVGTIVLFAVYFEKIKHFFIPFSPIPFLFLFFFYCGLFITYRYVKPCINLTIVEKLEARKVYFASISYRYIVYKSFDIVFQQTAILCILASLKDFAIPYYGLVLLFAISFSCAHIFMLNRGLVIGALFLGAALFGGLLFPILLNFQYGIFYTYILHWLFYIALGVLTHFSHKFGHNTKFAL